MERINIKKEHNQRSAVFKVLRQVSYYLNFTDLWMTSLIFIFLSCHEKALDNKKFSHEN